MSAQQACFTIHGQREEGLGEMVGSDCLRSFKIKMETDDGLERLRRLGISQSALFPTAEALAQELDWLQAEILPGGEG